MCLQQAPQPTLLAGHQVGERSRRCCDGPRARRGGPPARRRPAATAAKPVQPARGAKAAQASRSRARTLRRNSARSMPPAASGCLSAASSCTGEASGVASCAVSSRKLPGGDWSSGTPALSSTRTPQRSSSAATRRPRPRLVVTRVARLPGVSSARAAARRCGRPRRQGRVLRPARRPRCRQPAPAPLVTPGIGRFGRAEDLRPQRHARGRAHRRRGPRQDGIPVHADHLQQPLEPKLRMARADLFPGRRVESLVQRVQDHLTAGQAGDDAPAAGRPPGWCR